MEVIVATLIATLAVIGLAYTFGMGRGFIDRFEIARAALGAAEGRLEEIASLPAADPLATPLIQHTSNFEVGGQVFGTERWILTWVDDATDGLAPADLNPRDLRQLTVTVDFDLNSMPDSVRLTRLLPPQ